MASLGATSGASAVQPFWPQLPSRRVTWIVLTLLLISDCFESVASGTSDTSEADCIEVDIAASTVPPAGVAFMSLGHWTLLNSSCASNRCSIDVCNEKFLFVVSKGTAWSFQVGIAGIELASATVKKGVPFGLEIEEAAEGISRGEDLRWKGIEHGCCAPSTEMPLFSGRIRVKNESGLECMEQCLHFPSQCSYIQLSHPAGYSGDERQCTAYPGLCLPTDEPCERADIGVSKAWHRTGRRWTFVKGRNECYSEEGWRQQNFWNFTGVFKRCGTSSVCVDGACQDHCEKDEQCDGYPMRICKGKSSTSDSADKEKDAKCNHKALFQITVGEDVGAALVVFIVSGLALSAGIGGGGLYVPLMMVILQFTAHEATGLSQALLAGGASSTLVYNMRQRHPSGLKPMIDYDLALVMGPFLLIGALIGSSLNTAAPSWLILVLLTLVLCQSAWKTWNKAIKTLKKERSGEVKGLSASGDDRLSKNIIQRMLRGLGRFRRADPLAHARFEEAEAGAAESDPPALAANAASTPTAETVGAPALEEGNTPPKKQLSPEDVKVRVLGIPSPAKNAGGAGEAKQQSKPPKPASPQFPRDRLCQFAAMWMVTVGCIFVRGGRASKGLFEYCGAVYWTLTAAAIVILALLGLLGARRAVSEAKGVEDDDDWRWTLAAARRIILSSLGAGVLAALCGIGGGMIMGPILLDLGVLPQVQSSTTASTLFVLSSSAALAFLVQGTAPVDYALFLAVSTALGAVIGKAIIGFLVKLYRRPSAIIFLLGGIITASVVVMVITGTIDVVNDAQQGKGMGFKGVCDTDD